jgi:hypothetical protein
MDMMSDRRPMSFARHEEDGDEGSLEIITKDIEVAGEPDEGVVHPIGYLAPRALPKCVVSCTTWKACRKTVVKTKTSTKTRVKTTTKTVSSTTTKQVVIREEGDVSATTAGSTTSLLLAPPSGLPELFVDFVSQAYTKTIYLPGSIVTVVETKTGEALTFFTTRLLPGTATVTSTSTYQADCLPSPGDRFGEKFTNEPINMIVAPPPPPAPPSPPPAPPTSFTKRTAISTTGLATNTATTSLSQTTQTVSQTTSSITQTATTFTRTTMTRQCRPIASPPLQPYGGTTTSGWQNGTRGISPAGSSFAANSGGDGWDVGFHADGVRIYNIYHHKYPFGMDCHTMTGARCAGGYPLTIQGVASTFTSWAQFAPNNPDVILAWESIKRNGGCVV